MMLHKQQFKKVVWLALNVSVKALGLGLAFNYILFSTELFKNGHKAVLQKFRSLISKQEATVEPASKGNLSSSG